MAKWAAGERDDFEWLYLFDDHLVVFLIYAGNGLAIDKVTSTDPADVQLCRSAFEAVWKLSIPHSDYQPF
ncbi:MAG: DUF6879 family protein [Pseudonocardiaceae bacterium]